MKPIHQPSSNINCKSHRYKIVSILSVETGNESFNLKTYSFHCNLAPIYEDLKLSVLCLFYY